MFPSVHDFPYGEDPGDERYMSIVFYCQWLYLRPIQLPQESQGEASSCRFFQRARAQWRCTKSWPMPQLHLAWNSTNIYISPPFPLRTQITKEWTDPKLFHCLMQQFCATFETALADLVPIHHHQRPDATGYRVTDIPVQISLISGALTSSFHCIIWTAKKRWLTPDFRSKVSNW